MIKNILNRVGGPVADAKMHLGTCRTVRREMALLFHLLSKLFEHTIGLITTDLTFTEWSSIFGGAKMTTPLLDRLAHHCHIVATDNRSYRFRHSTKVAKVRIKSWERSRKSAAKEPSTQGEVETFGSRRRQHEFASSYALRSFSLTFDRSKCQLQESRRAVIRF